MSAKQERPGAITGPVRSVIAKAGRVGTGSVTARSRRSHNPDREKSSNPVIYINRRGHPTNAAQPKRGRRDAEAAGPGLAGSLACGTLTPAPGPQGTGWNGLRVASPHGERGKFLSPSSMRRMRPIVGQAAGAGRAHGYRGRCRSKPRPAPTDNGAGKQTFRDAPCACCAGQ